MILFNTEQSLINNTLYKNTKFIYIPVSSKNNKKSPGLIRRGKKKIKPWLMGQLT